TRGLADEPARRQALTGLDEQVLARGLQRLAHYSEPSNASANSSLFRGLGKDVRYSFRLLRNNPGFALVAIVTLALGIAANTAIFSVLNALFFHPPGINDPAHLVAVRAKYDKLNLPNIGISATDYADARDSKQIIASAAMAMPGPLLYTTPEGT